MSKDKDKFDFTGLDSVLDFLENEAPSETSLKLSQAAKERYLNPAYKEQWHKKNTARLEDDKFREKMSQVQKKWHAENPNAAKERVNTPEARANHRKAMQNYVNSPDYVNPRGMLGKKMTLEQRQKHSEAISGKPKPLEGNKKISEHFKGKKKDPKVVAKVSKTMKGRTHNRTRTVITTVKTFEKLNDAAQYFDVSPESIKNWINKKGKTIRCPITRQKLLDKGIKLDKNNYPIGFEWGNSINNLGAQKVHTDKGIFDNINVGAKAYGISANGLRFRCKSDKWPDFYYLDEKNEFKSPQLNDEN